MSLSVKPSGLNVDHLSRKMFDCVKSNAPSETTESGGFGSVLAQQIQKVTESAQAAQTEIEKVQNNQEDASLERTAFLMAQAEEELRTAVQVRNKAVSAYQEIMNMQI